MSFKGFSKSITRVSQRRHNFLPSSSSTAWCPSSRARLWRRPPPLVA